MAIPNQMNLASLIRILVLAWCSLLSARAAETFYVNYSAHIDPAVAQAYDFSILSPYSDAPAEFLRKNGHHCLAYISIIEIARDARYRQAALALGIPIIATNAAAGSDLVDITDPRWKKFVLGQLAAFAVERQYDGFFLDTPESVELLCQRYPARAGKFREALVDLIRGFKRSYPGRRVLINRGLAVWPSVRDSIDGVMIESLFQTCDEVSHRYAAAAASDTQALLQTARELISSGLPVYILDYVDPSDLALAAKTAERIAQAGFNPLISTPELDGRVLAPVRETPRWVLALYGNQKTDPRSGVRWPSDSDIALLVQSPLEWLGFEVDYLSPTLQPLPSTLGSRYAGIVLDRSLEIPPDREPAVAKWLIVQKNRGIKIVFLGEIPFQEPSARAQILRAFGWSGSGRMVAEIRTARAAVQSPRVGFEAPVIVHPELVSDLRAPPGSEILLSIHADSSTEGAQQFDPVFVAPWGGAILNPYGWFLRPDSSEQWVVDPFFFFRRALAVPGWPAPDPTTRDGLRVFYTHIDGDGFSDPSRVEAGKRSCQVIEKQVLQKFPFPYTCSVIEADIRALAVGQNPDDALPLAAMAREIFALPNVEAASHSYSHPFFWSDTDRTAVLYERSSLELRPPFNQSHVDAVREVAGSVHFINEHLLPPGKHVRIFLWPGNCRPEPEAIRLTQQLGIENMNGGDTIISRKNPSVARVAARSMPWDDQLQIYSSNQNENIYAERWHPRGDWNGPFHGGFINVLDSFRRTESPRRLTALNIYFHWYSGDDSASLRSLTKVFDWASTQPLHAMPASEFAAIIRDSRSTRLFRRSNSDWIIINSGKLRTFRLGESELLPDLSASRGVIGYNRSASGGWYIHTDGSARVSLALTAKPPRHLYLDSSSAEIDFRQLAASEAAFFVRDLRPCHVVLGGFSPGATALVMINNTPSTQAADAHGRLILDLPKEAAVAVKTS